MKRSSLSIFHGIILASVGLASCADIFGIRGGEIEDASTGDGGSVDATDAAPGKDALSIDVNTAVCDGGPAVVPDTDAIWVSHNAVAIDNGNCGAKTAPCGTIGVAITNAKTAGKKVIYLDAAKYNEVIELDSNESPGWTIQGGWKFDGTTWTAQCQSNLATIQPDDSASASYAVHVAGASGLTMRLLTISSKNIANATTSESVYALMVVDTQIALDSVTLIAQNAANGANGAVGADFLQCSPFSSGTGGPGGGGTAGPAGTFMADGYHPAQASIGIQGDWGTATSGNAGQCDACVSCSMNPEAGCATSTTQDCAQNGDQGCAGQGGAGGQGGWGGGAAIALYLGGPNPSVAVTAGGFVVGSGGNGGQGGSGQSGGAGATGSTGNDFSLCGQGVCNWIDGGFGCGPSKGYITLSGGSGGQGGTGGNGGTGGGGCGGPTYYYAAPAATNISLLTQSVTLGNSSFLGSAGAGGAPNGDAGEQAPNKVYP